MDAGDVDMAAPETTETVNVLPRHLLSLSLFLCLNLTVSAQRGRSIWSIDCLADLLFLASVLFYVGHREWMSDVAVCS